MIDIKDQCRNKWASILAMLGVPESCLRDRHGPCPLCGGKDRFRFDDKEGNGTWFCNQCGAGRGMDLAMRKTGLSYKDCANAIRERLGDAVERKPKQPLNPEAAREAMNALWRGATPISNDGAMAHLTSRGLRGPYPACLRFHAAAECVERRARLPAMLALVRAPDGSVANIHRTYLEGGRKANLQSPRRLMAGSLPDGAAIRLYPHSGILGVAEGIETAMAVTRDFGIPCWSLINASNMAKFVPPEDVQELHIFGDNDPKYGGQAAAWTLAHRVACRPNAPKVIPPKIPEIVGADWADPMEKERAA